jgi:hypothetical protein
MRAIEAAIWRDEWFMDQCPEAQLLWLGLITKIADDQGRFTYRADLIKADLFATNDEIETQDISAMLVFFITDGRLIKYDIGEKTLLQMVNWWKYQKGANFMNASKYAPPEGWVDCWRYHGKGNAEIKSENWLTKQAGFVKLPSILPSQLPSGNACNDVKDDVKVNDDVEVEVEQEPKHPPAAASISSAVARNQYMANVSVGSANTLLLNVAKLAAIPMDQTTRIETVYQMIQQYGEEKTRTALTQAREKWIITPGKTGKTYSPLNFGWVDWAMGMLSEDGLGAKPEKPDPFASLNTYLAVNNVEVKEKKFVPNPNSRNPLKGVTDG